MAGIRIDKSPPLVMRRHHQTVLKPAKHASRDFVFAKLVQNRDLYLVTPGNRGMSD
jgi:hypothetical protein